MTEQNFDKFMERMDEIWAHKEAVASNVLYDLGQKVHALNQTASQLQKDVNALDVSLNSAVREIREDMKMKHKDIEYIEADHSRRLSFMEKIMLSVAAMIGMAFMGGLIALVFK